MKIDTTTITEEILLKIKKTGRQTISHRTITKILGEVLKYIVENVEEELKNEGIKITK